MRNLKKQVKMPNHSQQIARMLIDQQMWCWGCDVRRIAGNLLLLYGAKKRPSPNPRYHSAYVFQIEGEALVNLWGWGLWIACPHRGSLFIGRSRFQVCYTRDAVLMPDAWCKRDLPLTTSEPDNDDLEYAHDLLATALHWIGSYEDWLSTQVASDYREHILAKWPQRRRYKGGIPAAEMAERWFELSTCLSEIPDN